MKATLDALIAQLDGLLEAENAALARMDIETVSALTVEKHDIVERLRTMLAATGREQILDVMALRPGLPSAIEANTALLERALKAQRNVIGLVASASRPTPTTYGRRGHSTAAVNAPRAMIASA